MKEGMGRAAKVARLFFNKSRIISLRNILIWQYDINAVVKMGKFS